MNELEKSIQRQKVARDDSYGKGKLSLKKIVRLMRKLVARNKGKGDINQIYSILSVGEMITIPKYGHVVIKKFVVKNRKRTFDTPTDPHGITKKKRRTSFRTVRRLVVVYSTESLADTEHPRIKKIKLPPDVTKKIMLRYLVQKRQYNLLLQMYPEERYNLSGLIKKYANMAESDPDDPAELSE